MDIETLEKLRQEASNGSIPIEYISWVLDQQIKESKSKTRDVLIDLKIHFENISKPVKKLGEQAEV